MKKQYNSKDYVILLKNFSLEDEQYTNDIFRKLTNTPTRIVSSNGGSDNWHFIIEFKQEDDSDHSKDVSDFMSPVLSKYKLHIEKVWPKE